MANVHLVEDEIAKLKQEKETLMQEVVRLQQENVLNSKRIESLNNRISSAEERQKQMVSFLAKVLRNPMFISHLKRLKEQKGIEYAARAERKFLKPCTSSFSSSSAITLNDITESDNKQKQVADDLLKNLNDKGKTIMKEMDNVMDPIFCASEDDYLLSLPENIMINSESEVERDVHGKFVGSEATYAMNEGGVDEGWEGIDVGTGESYLSDNAWDMSIGGYNDQDSFWGVGLNSAEDDLDIDNYIAGASLLEEFKNGAQLNQDQKL